MSPYLSLVVSYRIDQGWAIDRLTFASGRELVQYLVLASALVGLSIVDVAERP